MKTPPKIGQRIVCHSAWGNVTGAVVKIYPSLDKRTLEYQPFDPDTWAASVLIDHRPPTWPFQSKRFAPAISEISPLA